MHTCDFGLDNGFLDIESTRNKRKKIDPLEFTKVKSV